MASHASWANTADPTARTANGRAAFLSRFEHEVDPDGVLPELERQRRADHARKSYFAGLALASARARRHKKNTPGTKPEALDDALVGEEVDCA